MYSMWLCIHLWLSSLYLVNVYTRQATCSSMLFRMSHLSLKKYPEVLKEAESIFFDTRHNKQLNKFCV